MEQGGPSQKLTLATGMSATRTLGQYVIDERLSAGGSAEVFLAHPVAGNAAERVVIKRLLEPHRKDADARAAFLEEAALHRRFRHPNIVQCFEIGDEGGEPFLVMELVLGADLHRVIRLVQVRQRPLTPPLACYIAREILAALAVVHAASGDDATPLGIVHRDVSPSNVYLSTAGDVKLGDFGIARPASGRGPRPAAGGGPSIKGKVAYLAPEQVASEATDGRADLFALASVTAEMMLGKPLFTGAGQLAILLSIRDARVDALDAPSAIPSAVVRVLKRALARDPKDRFPDASAFANALKPFAVQDLASARREIAQLVRWARETSMELRAVGGHPDQAELIEPLNQIARPQPSLRLDSAIPREEAPDEETTFDLIPPAPVPPTQVGPRPAIHDAVTAPYAPRPSRVRTTDGREIGPLTYAKLVELVVTGHLSSDDEVDFIGIGFKRLGDIDEFSRHLAPRSTVTKPLQGPGAPDWHGLAAEEYDDRIGGAAEPGIAVALAYAASNTATGVLLAQQGARRKEIYFAAGRVLHVASTEPGEMLGEYLVSRGVLDRADLDFALAVLPRFNGHLGEALTGIGVVEPVVMFNAIREQGRDKIVDIFFWTEGDLSFYRDGAPTRVEFPLDLPIGPVVEAGIAAMLDETRARARFQPWLDRKLRLGAAAHALVDCTWSPAVERVLQACKEPRTVKAVLALLGQADVTPLDVLRAIESARVAGVLDWAS